MKDIKVVIRCITYNQEKYIAQALDGFVMQQTNFKFVAVVHDDASTDGTADIVKEYAEKYPDIIKPIFETENLYSKGNGLLKKVMDEACSQYEPIYIALCEGDDYWTDPYKLQKQVDIMDKHPEYSCCVHECKEWVENEKEYRPHQISYLKNFKGYGIAIDLKEYVKIHFFTRTLSALYRMETLEKSKFRRYDAKHDMAMFYALATQGPIYLINQTMGVYRINDGGVTAPHNRMRFFGNMLYHIFSICREEKTIYAQEFVYKTVHEFIIYFIIYRRDLLMRCLQYLGLKYNVMLLLYDLPKILFDITKERFR